MTKKEFFNRSLEISTEFDRYVLAHPEIAEKMPQDALVVFWVEDEPEFNKKSVEIAHKQRDLNQPVLKVKVQKVLRVSSVNPMSF